MYESVDDLLDHVGKLDGAQVVYPRGGKPFGGKIVKAEVVMQAGAKILRLTMDWQAYHEANGWHPYDEAQIDFAVANMIKVTDCANGHLEIALSGKRSGKVITFAPMGTDALINKVRGLKI